MVGKVDHAALPGYMLPEHVVCRQCGCQMRPNVIFEDVSFDTPLGNNVVRRYSVKQRAVRISHYGYGAENLFCTLTCGYIFACWKIKEDK